MDKAFDSLLERLAEVDRECDLREIQQAIEYEDFEYRKSWNDRGYEHNPLR